jgi:hypothetical protein
MRHSLAKIYSNQSFFFVFLFCSLLFVQSEFFGQSVDRKSSTSQNPAALNKTVPPALFEASYPLLEAKAGYFFFASEKMSEVYRDGGFEVQLSGSFPIYRCLQVYASAGYLQAWGQSENGHQDTTIWEIPIDLGLKPVLNIASYAQYYIALGPRYFYVHQHNDSSYVNRNLSKNGVGFFINTGFNFFPIRHLLIDIFGEYAYEAPRFSSSKPNVFGGKIQISKFTFGAGVGYAF